MPHRFEFISCALVFGLYAGTPSVLGNGGISTVDKLVKTLTSQPKGKLTAQTAREANQYIDYAYIARYAMGDTRWEHLSETKKDEYVAAVRRSLEKRYYPRWRKLFGKGTLEELGESHAGGGSFVNTALTVGKRKSLVIWHLQGDEKQLKVVDLEVDGEDLLYRLRKRIQKVLEKNGQDRLITMLNRMGEEE